MESFRSIQCSPASILLAGDLLLPVRVCVLPKTDLLSLTHSLSLSPSLNIVSERVQGVLLIQLNKQQNNNK